ncbi:MAG: type II toxin-antitoxin system RelE/ParE family toxin [Candidatus Aenigmarchaeota archaeon]|nr:type II toxin-antitoxin system RelE/ParE family toxin [Candidatus Aenigmarchaeota archaeon]
MSFNVILHPSAAKFLESLDGQFKERVKNKLEELKQYPERGKPLKYSHFRSLRIGDYRALYEIHRASKEVVILFIGHRRDVYDDFSKLI